MLSPLALLALLAIAIGGPLAAQPAMTNFESVSGPENIDSTTQSQGVELGKDANNRMTVAVNLSGTGPYRFLVDTGSDRTAVSREVATRLKLLPGKNATMHSITGSSEVRTVRIPELRLSKRQINVADAPLLSSVNMGADGILGIDSLRSQRVVLDFKAAMMTIVPSAQRPVASEDKDTIVVRARERNGRLILTHASANGVPVTIVLDTGSEVCLGNAALRSALLGRKQLKPAGTTELTSVTGARLRGDYMFLKKLDLGDVALENLAVVFAPARTFDQLGLNDRPALLLGMNAMRGFDRVSIDFARKQLRVVVPERSALDGATMAWSH